MSGVSVSRGLGVLDGGEAAACWAFGDVVVADVGWVFDV